MLLLQGVLSRGGVASPFPLIKFKGSPSNISPSQGCSTSIIKVIFGGTFLCKMSLVGATLFHSIQTFKEQKFDTTQVQEHCEVFLGVTIFKGILARLDSVPFLTAQSMK